MKINRLICWLLCLLCVFQLLIDPVSASQVEETTAVTDQTQAENNNVDGAIDTAVAYGSHSLTPRFRYGEVINCLKQPVRQCCTK